MIGGMPPVRKPAKLVSFGFKYGLPEGAPLNVVDVLALFPRNPHRLPSLQKLSGLDAKVAADILRAPGFQPAWKRLQEQVGGLAEAGCQVVYLGCQGGRHRSVYLADRLGREWGVEVEHRDLGKGDRETRAQKIDRQRGRAADKVLDPIRAAIDRGELTITGRTPTEPPLQNIPPPGSKKGDPR